MPDPAHEAGSPGATQLTGGFREFFALEHNLVILLAALLILGMGGQLWSSFAPKYLEALGATALVIGVHGTLEKVIDALYTYPGGVISDGLGHRRALVLFNLLAAVGYVVYLLSPNWPVFFLGTLLVMAWTSMSQPAILVFIGDSLPSSKRAMGFSVQSIWYRVPIVLAPPLGGLLIDRLGARQGTRIGLGITVLLALLATFVQRHFYQEPRPPRSEDDAEGLWSLWRELRPGLKQLLLADCLVRVGSNTAALYLVLYVINVLRGSASQFGLLTSARMLTSILLYIPAARLADRSGRRPFIAMTFPFFTLFPLVLVLGPDTRWLLPAFVIAGLSEIGEPARKALIVDLASEAHRGRAIGLYYLIRGLCVMPAPLIGGLLWGIAPRLPFLAGFAAMAAGTLGFIGWGPAENSEPDPC